MGEHRNSPDDGLMHLLTDAALHEAASENLGHLGATRNALWMFLGHRIDKWFALAALR